MPSSNGKKREEKLAVHWRRLTLLPGAPDCVINEAYRYHIRRAHPDQGGSEADAKRVNIARDELRGHGAEPNEHVAQHFHGEPWHVLGLASNADAALAERAGRALQSELSGLPKLASRVTWAISNYGKHTGASLRRPPPQPSASSRARTPQAGPRPPATAGLPEGLVERLDFGTLTWGKIAELTVRLTWREYAPYTVRAECEGPVRASVSDSKALPGRFIVTVGIDWEAPELAGTASLRGYTLDAPLTLRWGGGGEAVVRVKGVLLYPALISASPEALDLGAVRLEQPVRASLVLVSSAPVQATIEAAPWLRRVDGAGKGVDGPLRLQTNTPVRVAFAVDWAPIIERAADQIAAQRPVRPTGRVVVRWDGRELVVPAQMVVETRR